MRFRVWCLSWAEAEEHGMNVAKAPDYDTAFTTVGDTILVSPYCALDAEEAAEQYADYVHSHRDGWESNWPLEFRVRLPDGTTEDYDVDREAVPQFRASRKRVS